MPAHLSTQKGRPVVSKCKLEGGPDRVRNLNSFLWRNKGGGSSPNAPVIILASRDYLIDFQALDENK